MSIIVGVDFSEASHKVLDIAGALARTRGEHLRMVHAVDGPVFPRHRERLELEVVRMRATGVEASGVADSGAVADVIARASENAAQDETSLVVVGAQGEGQRGLLGTAATAVLRRVTHPLLVVRAAERLAPLMAGPHDTSRLRVLVCIALDDTEPGVVDALGLLSPGVAVDAEVAHFHPIPEEPPERHDAVRLALRDMVEVLGPLPVNVQATPLVRDAYGRLDVHVGDLARARDVDLVVCGSHRRHGLERLRAGSVAEGIVRHAPVSVLVGVPPLAGRGAPRRSVPGGF